MTPEQQDLLRHWLDGGVLTYRRLYAHTIGTLLTFPPKESASEPPSFHPDFEWRKAVPPLRQEWFLLPTPENRGIYWYRHVTADSTHKLTITWPEGDEPTASIGRIAP